MFVPPEQRRHWLPPQPDDAKSGRGDTVLLVLVVVFLLSMLLAPLGGSTLIQAFVAALPR